MPAPSGGDGRGSMSELARGTQENAKSAPSSPGWAKVKYKTGKGPHAKRSRLTWSQALHVLRRLTIVAAAVYFVFIELAATYKTMSVLRGVAIPAEDYGNYKSNFIGKFLGTGAIRDSPLVMDVLGNDTTPRDATIYIASETTAGFEQCETAKKAGLYDDVKLRMGFAYLTRTLSYNLTFMAGVELIAPVVDCSFEGMSEGDPSLTRVYNLVRNVTNPEDVYILGMALSYQEYLVPEQERAGTAYVAVMSLVRDMSGSVEIYIFLTLDYPYQAIPVYYVCDRLGLSASNNRILRTISRDPATDPEFYIWSSRRRGFFFNNEIDQSNFVTMNRMPEVTNPTKALTTLRWEGKPAIVDSWAWVHGIHFIFAMKLLFSLLVLFNIMVRNWQQGKIWVGDAFATLSNGTLVFRMLLVLLAWHVNEYWVLTEFSLANGSELSGSHKVLIHDEFVVADMLVLMFGVLSLIGLAIKERIDPGFVMFLFVGIHSNRLVVIRWFPTVSDYLAGYTKDEFFEGITDLPEIESKATTLRLWTTHRLEHVAFKFLAVSFFPKYIIIAIVLAYTLARKIYHHFYPDQVLRRMGRSSATQQSSSSESELVEKRSLTVFELATGALLRSRFGLISDYNNYVFIKGLKFASADGIYCSGYVIANGKFLVATDDIFAIALMKLLRSRLYNVYVYDVEGNSVQQTARLVYPDTLSWKDLTRLNTSILS